MINKIDLGTLKSGEGKSIQLSQRRSLEIKQVGEDSVCINFVEHPEPPQPKIGDTTRSRIQAENWMMDGFFVKSNDLIHKYSGMKGNPPYPCFRALRSGKWEYTNFACEWYRGCDFEIVPEPRPEPKIGDTTTDRATAQSWIEAGFCVSGPSNIDLIYRKNQGTLEYWFDGFWVTSCYYDFGDITGIKEYEIVPEPKPASKKLTYEEVQQLQAKAIKVVLPDGREKRYYPLAGTYWTEAQLCYFDLAERRGYGIYKAE